MNQNIAWAANAMLCALLLTLAALVAERVAEWMGWSRRWIWVCAMFASIGLAFVPHRGTAVVPPFVQLAPAGTVHAMTSSAQAQQTPSTPVLPGVTAKRAPEDSSGGEMQIWLALSALMLLTLSVTYVQLRRVRSRAERSMIAATPVRVTDRTGPAVIGFAHPEIVVPRATLMTPFREQRLIVLHERSHIEHGDHWLLAAGALCVIAMPWNACIWWQRRRLSLAVETDCDARVLAAGEDRESYGRALIQSARDMRLSFLSASWGSGTSQLAHRIVAMTARPPKHRALRSLAAIIACAALSIAAVDGTADAVRKPEIVDVYTGLLARGLVPSLPSPSRPAAETRVVSDVAQTQALSTVRIEDPAGGVIPVRVTLASINSYFVGPDGVRMRARSIDIVTPYVATIVAPDGYRLIARVLEAGRQVEIGGTGVLADQPKEATAKGDAPMLDFRRVRDTAGDAVMAAEYQAMYALRSEAPQGFGAGRGGSGGTSAGGTDRAGIGGTRFSSVFVDEYVSGSAMIDTMNLERGYAYVWSKSGVPVQVRTQWLGDRVEVFQTTPFKVKLPTGDAPYVLRLELVGASDELVVSPLFPGGSKAWASGESVLVCGSASRNGVRTSSVATMRLYSSCSD